MPCGHIPLYFFKSNSPLWDSLVTANVPFLASSATISGLGVASARLNGRITAPRGGGHPGTSRAR